MKLESGCKENFADYSNIVLEQWKTYVEMANSNTEKRASANNIFITINLALLAVTPFSLDFIGLNCNLYFVDKDNQGAQKIEQR